MNNQEAIASLRTLCHTCKLFPKCAYEKPECFKAIEMAISALQAQEAKNSNKSSLTQKRLDTIQAQDVPDTNVGKMDGDELDEAIRHCEAMAERGNGYAHFEYICQERRQLASWLRELKRLRTEVYFLKAEKENEPVDMLGDVPCKTCKWRVATTEKCEECIDGVSDNYEVQEPCEDAVSREAAIDAALSAFTRGLLASPDIRKLPSVQPDQYIKEKSVDIGYLHDWYQNSVTDDPPVWTDEHIKEMFCDFYMIPRQGKEREEIMNEFDRTSGGY